MSFKSKVRQIARWWAADAQRPSSTSARTAAARGKPNRSRFRMHRIEAMEPRHLMAADPIWVGGVYIEDDSGTDDVGDSFYITFKGGAPGTQLTKLIINGDQNTPGFGFGDMIFDTVEGVGLGADHASAFKIISLNTANPNASVTATVQDGSSLLVLDFTNFVAGDTLLVTIDVDEVQGFDPSVTDLDEINDSIDPIASGVEFQNSLFEASFVAPHYENVSGQDKFLNRYDTKFAQAGLPFLPADNDGGLRDRTTGALATMQQVPKPISLAGTVFVDNNRDLRIQNTEQRLPGVKLDLFRLENGTYVATGFSTTTDAQGNYLFGTSLGLMPGTYQVRETQPTGYFSVGAAPGKLDGSGVAGQTVSGNPDWLTQIVIPLGDQHATELNFGEIQPSSLSGRVCVSEGAFDCFDDNATKSPLAGVTVNLHDSTGAIIATQLTAADGTYKFSNLLPGTYSISQITPSNLIDGAAKVGSISGQIVNASEIRNIVLGGGVDGTEYNFCELVPSEISGHTFYDQNNNGRRDTGEVPLANVVVVLWNEQGQRVAETRTNSQGFYKFENLAPGTYRVTEVTPAGYLPGQAAVGTISGVRVGSNDSTGDVLSQIRLPAGRQGINYDFGELLPGSISGHVIVDTNGNCIVDVAEDRYLGGVTMELLDSTGNVIRTTVTDANGFYKFDGLPIGSYSVRELQPAGLLQGGQKVGSGGGNASVTDLISQIQVGSGMELVGYDFCEIPPAEISGMVYVDANQDCVFQANESPLAGVTITLLDATGIVVATTLTDAAGRYKFTGLKPGDYSVRQQQPAGYFQGGQKAGSGGGDDSQTDVISSIGIGAGAKLVNYDFCERLPASISGTVFVDLDFDCVQDEGEVSLENVLIELLDSNGQVIASTRTDAQGNYRFDNLEPGTYAVRETQPAGYFQGGQMAPATGGDASVDDLISSIVLLSGMAVTEADFCEIPPAKIAGYVFQDGAVIETEDGLAPQDIRSVRDGIRTSDDKPLAGVTLQLRFINGLIVTSDRTLPGYYTGEYVEVVTDENGYFEFDGLREAPYHIVQAQPAGYIDSLDTPGTTGGFSVNQNDVQPEFVLSMLLDLQDVNPFDVLLRVNALAGQVSQENNFSEVLVKRADNPVPPLPPTPPDNPRFYAVPQVFAPGIPLVAAPMTWAPLPLLIGVGHDAPPTWHLSVINAGYPRGRRGGEPLAEEQIAENTERLNVFAWTVRGMRESSWKIVSTKPSQVPLSSRIIFDLPGAQPLTGDFNGDGFDEIALFLDGEWFIDINGNGRWDEADIWLKLGSRGDQPVVGDWDGDGKDDAGVFGKKWSGDERAIAAEHGLPDPENMRRIKPKNLPPREEEAPDESRLLQRSQQGPARADLIDHVFIFGSGKDIAISGDFNGDGISTIGVFRDGQWTLDVDGDGRLSYEHDRRVEFGEAGDLPLVGDFDGDGIDELAILRGNHVYVDSNDNGHIDATDQVFELENEEGTVIVGDFDGDGRDEPALHQSADRPRTARKAS